MLDIAEALKTDSWQTAVVCSENVRKPSKSELVAISKLMRRDATDGEIYTFPALAIDETPTRNGVIYSGESQRKSLKSWYGIPFLFNPHNGGLFSGGDHDLKASSQFGRIYKAEAVDTGNGKVGTLLWIYSVPGVSEALAEFCNKIDTGILREVSIHVMADQVECSICGKQFGEDGHTHWPLEKYGNQTAYMKTVGKFTPLELSSVACPGSTIAHVMSDEDAANLLPLREALGGSRAAVEAIMNRKKGLHESSDAPADADKDDEECEDGQPGKKGGKSGDQPKPKDKAGEEADDGERQPAPSTRTQSAKTGKAPKPGKGTNKDGDGSEDMDEGKDEDDECDEATDPDDEPDDNDDNEPDKDGGGKPVGRNSKSKKKETLGLFSGETCVVCNRSDVGTAELSEAQREAVISEYKEEVEEIILGIKSAAEKQVKAAQKESARAIADSKEARAMRELFVTELVDLSISKGLQETSSRETYTEELLGLSFDGLKILRETVSKAQTSRQSRMEALESEFKRSPAPKHFASETSSPKNPKAKPTRFAATIGPN